VRHYRVWMLGILLVAVIWPAYGAQTVKNPDTLVYARTGRGTVLDPAYAYDGPTLEMMIQVYECLIAYKDGSANEFVPLLASQVPTVENGLVSEDLLTYRFPIRKGVRFSNGSELTPEDVEYSFERVMVMDPTGGPIWMLLEVLLGVISTRDGEGGYRVTFDQIDKTVEVQGDTVVFHLAKPSPFFLQILALPWGSIVDKETVIAMGGWPGTAETWQDYNNLSPEKSVLRETMIGTGPFILESWTPGVEAVFVRNENYWREPPALKRAIIKRVDEWSTRRLLLANGDADIVEVPHPFLSQVEAIEGVRVIKGLPLFTTYGIHFNQNIVVQDNQYVGSGKLDGNGISPDFFSDINTRKAFSYAFNGEQYIQDVWGGDAIQLASCIPKGMKYFDPSLEPYPYDPELAEYYFRKAFNGEVWDKGFRLTFLVMSGDEVSKAAAEVLELGVESINPKFHVDIQTLQMGAFVQEILGHRAPVFVWAWTADFLDPHNFTQPYMHSTGFYSGAQGIKEYDDLVEQGGSMPDGPARETIYRALQCLCHQDAISIFPAQPLAWHVERTWVQGWYQFIPQWNLTYFYPLRKVEG